MSSDSTVRDAILEHFQRSAELKLRTAAACADDIARAAEMIANTFRSGGKLLICGNGGSAADAQHMAAEFVSRLTLDFERPGLPAIALTTDTSMLTAYANDFDFDGVFCAPGAGARAEGRCISGISTSGRPGMSPRVRSQRAISRYDGDYAHRSRAEARCQSCRMCRFEFR